MKLLLVFASKHNSVLLSKLDIDAALIGSFLDHLEQDRKNSARTRNARLATIRSLFRFAALRHPEHAATVERVLAVHSKRFERGLVTYLQEEELVALLAAPDGHSWTGQHDRALFTLAAQTGMRVSEIINLQIDDIHLGVGAHVSCTAKGRKMRITPITSQVASLLMQWLRERNGLPTYPLFVSRTSKSLSRDAIVHRLAKYVDIAGKSCPSLVRKRITIHVLRHGAAMRLLRAGIEQSVIALWLGHEQVGTTDIYLHADMPIKERALAKTASTSADVGRFEPDDELLGFLEAL